MVRAPRGPGPHPAVAFVDGSGPAERDSFEEEAEALARAGFAGLGWDKPGCGSSGGDWRDQSLQDRASEALAAVGCLAAQEGVDPTRVALLGGSQGGWVGPLAASMSEGVAAVISLSGPGVSPYDQEAYRVEHLLRDAGAPRTRSPMPWRSSTGGRAGCAAATTSTTSWRTSSPTGRRPGTRPWATTGWSSTWPSWPASTTTTRSRPWSGSPARCWPSGASGTSTCPWPPASSGSRPPWGGPATAASAWRWCPTPTTACACRPPAGRNVGPASPT